MGVDADGIHILICLSIRGLKKSMLKMVNILRRGGGKWESIFSSIETNSPS